jgi:RNA polymerase sigma-70 factor, ECF subfamily
MSGTDRTPTGDKQDDAEDVRLMESIARGDTAAFEQLIERHQALVIGTVARMLGSNSDVEDLAQQVFLRVWRSASRYVPKAKFTTWLLKITRNLVFNEMRRTKRQALVPMQAEGQTEELPMKDESVQSPAEALLEHELQKAIEDAIIELPVTQRMALVLRRYEGRSYEEIGDILDLSVPAVKSVLFRARTELRVRLASYLKS